MSWDDYPEAYGRLEGAVEVAIINLEHGHTKEQVADYLRGALERARRIAHNDRQEAKE